jgi:hypothetical protein
VLQEHLQIKCPEHYVCREKEKYSFNGFVSFLASIFSQSETSEALTEICRVDPTFDVAQFLRIVQYDIIPNIFEVKEDFKSLFN